MEKITEDNKRLVIPCFNASESSYVNEEMQAYICRSVSKIVTPSAGKYVNV